MKPVIVGGDRLCLTNSDEHPAHVWMDGDIQFVCRGICSVTLYSAPGETGPRETPGFIADTPENRAALEAVAIPRCREWREANRELIGPAHAHLHAPCTDRCYQPAPYCCSAYCDRCAGLRALNGDDPALLPNEWMHR